MQTTRTTQTTIPTPAERSTATSQGKSKLQVFIDVDAHGRARKAAAHYSVSLQDLVSKVLTDFIAPDGQLATADGIARKAGIDWAVEIIEATASLHPVKSPERKLLTDLVKEIRKRSGNAD